MKLKELLNRVSLIVSGMTPEKPENHPLLSPEVFVELLLPRALQLIVDELLTDPSSVSTANRAHSVKLASGEGRLPPNLPERYVEAFEVTVAGKDESATASWEQSYSNYQRDANVNVAKFHVRGDSVYYRGIGSSAGASTDLVTIYGPTVPNVPRRTASVSSIATTNPAIVITTAAHGLSSGDTVYIYGTQGAATGVNGYNTVGSSSNSTSLVLIGIDNSGGSYTGGGTILGPPDWETTDLDLPDYLVQKLIHLLAGIVISNPSLTELARDPASTRNS